MSDTLTAPMAGGGRCRQRTRRMSRWWLAGLLVGCLLPTSLSHAEALRFAEQLTQICLMAPAAIRAESRRVARRRARRCLPPRRRRPATPVSQAHDARVALRPRSTGLDSLNPRGPPRLV
ncbi:hypothetical protein [Modicisalibacter coralii]|uniref:hypothetical protein n=1 Tax=Modicisalibacter coralii TaxID=2304602 RepID=UPI001F1A579E|nr:hypothetical protein [Halomonas coralii]